jgi:hypothetical protein
MKFLLIAATIVVLSLIACSGPSRSTSEIGPENTFVETPGYTGVIISKNGASEFGYLFDGDSTEFWAPSINDVSRAEECIRQFLVFAQQNSTLDPYQKENPAYILRNLEKYRRQYVGIVVDGEKRIWINSFFSDDSFPNWTRSPVYLLDGGNHFWQIEYIPLKDECINFYVHGEA